MATYTTNYQLHQWEASDNFLRTDFNADFAKIDAAVKAVADAAAGLEASKAAQTALEAVQALAEGKCRVVTGKYVGTGTSRRTITLGFMPKVVFVYTSSRVPALGTPDTGSGENIQFTENGFWARRITNGNDLDQLGLTYYYYALV